MNVEVRIYKRYDTDLLSLHDAGYSVTKMMTEAVSAYANGRSCHFIIDEIVPFDMNDKKSVRLRLKFKDSDRNTAALIRNVKHGYRSNFCKQILRNALIQQNLFCYFSDNSMLPLHQANLNTYNLQAFPGLKKCSEYRRKVQQISIMGKNITIQHEQGYRINPGSTTQKGISQNVQPQNNGVYPHSANTMVQPTPVQMTPSVQPPVFTGQDPSAISGYYAPPQMNYPNIPVAPPGNIPYNTPQVQTMPVQHQYVQEQAYPSGAYQQPSYPAPAQVQSPPIQQHQPDQAGPISTNMYDTQTPVETNNSSAGAPKPAQNNDLMSMFDNL